MVIFVHVSLAASRQDGYEISCRHMRNKMRGLFPSSTQKDGPSRSSARLSEREDRLGKQTDSWCFRDCPGPKKIHLGCLRPGRDGAQASVSSSGKARLPRGHGMCPGRVHRAPQAQEQSGGIPVCACDHPGRACGDIREPLEAGAVLRELWPRPLLPLLFP